MPTITAFDGVPVGPSTAYDIDWQYGSDYDWNADLSFSPRSADTPIYQTAVLVPATRTGRIKPGSAAPASMDEWREDVLRTFRPGPLVRLLTVEHRTTAMDVPVAVARLAHRTDTAMRDDLDSMFEWTIVAPSPPFRATTPITSPSGAPGTSDSVAVGGNYPAVPVVTITPSASGKRARVTITDNTGRGLMNYLVVVGGGGATEGGSLDTTTAGTITAANMVVFHNKAPIPFLVSGIDTTNTIVRFLVSVKGNASTTVDICWSPDIDNQVTAQALNPGGFDLAHADFGNDAWVWRDTATTIEGVTAPAMWEVSRAPNRAGSWRMAKLGTHPQGSSYQLTEGSGSLTINVLPDATGRNDADAIIMNAQVEAGSTNALDNITANSSMNGGGFPSSFTAGTLRYMLPGDGLWREASGTNPADIDGSIQEAFVATKAEFPAAPDYSDTNFTLTIDQDGANVMKRTHDSTKIPTVAIATPVDIAVLDGDIENTTTGRTIELRSVIVDVADGLVINCLDEQIEPLEAVRYWPNPDEGVRFAYEADVSMQGLWPFQEDTTNDWTSPWTTEIAIYERWLI